jgi:hypothetical protein
MIYSDEASAVLSGGILQGYFQTYYDSINYGESCNIFPLCVCCFGRAKEILGVVKYDESIGNILPLSAFSNLSSVMATIKPTSTNLVDYTPAISTPACPTLSSKWNASTVLPPTPYEPLCSCIYNSLRCVMKSDARIDGPLGYNSVTLLGDSLMVELEDICEGLDNCKGIWGRLDNGEYGAFR